MLFFGLIGTLLTTSCNVSKHLQDNEYLVKKNKVIIDDPKNSKTDPSLIYNLESFVIQKPNGNYAVVYPKELIYFRKKEQYDTTENKKGLLKNAELPVIFDKRKMIETAQNMEKYLRFSKGFYFAKVIPNVILREKSAYIEYHVTTEFQYKVRNKNYYGDSTMIEVILNYEKNSFLVEGSPVDEKVFDNEKSRIVSHLQSIGYARFNKNHIDFKADSTDMNKQMDVFVTILPPSANEKHRKYNFGDIKVYTDYVAGKDITEQNVTELNNINYYFDEKMSVRAKTLNRSISLKPRKKYNKNNIDNTYSSLAALGTYRFVNIIPTLSTEQDSIIDFEIFLTPITKPWTFQGFLETFFTRTNVNLLGFSASPSLRNINFLGGGEKFSTAIEASTEIVLPEFGGAIENPWTIQNLGVTFQNGLSYPTILDPYGRFLLKKFLPDQDKFKTVNNQSTTNLSLNYGFVSQLRQYVQHSVNLNYNYNIDASARYKYSFRPLSFNLLYSIIHPENTIFIDNPLLTKSFTNRLISGFVFQEFTYNINTPIFTNGFKYTATFKIEQSGAEVTTANIIRNGFKIPDDYWNIRFGKNSVEFEFAKYVLTELELTGLQQLKGDHALAGRFRFGLGVPYGGTVLPYVKQFYVGGPNSIRGWAPRELGPGAVPDPTSNKPTQIFSQASDMVLEGNLEYRFPISSFLEGGLFLDAGNIWSLPEKDTITDSEFGFKTFGRQIAVAYGIGLRIDLSFLIIRFDIGYKLRQPYKDDETQKYWIKPQFNAKYLGSLYPSIAIDYPF